MEGQKEALGLWLARAEGAKFWLQIITELRNRGIEDIFIACVDGLKGFPDAIATVFPETQVQLCIVRKIRHSFTILPYFLSCLSSHPERISWPEIRRS